MAVVVPVKDLPGASWHSGYMRYFRDDPLGLLVGCARRGDAVSFRFGLSRVVLLSHPDLIEGVLVAHAADFRKSAGTLRLRSLLGDGLLTSDGETWRRQRRLAQPAFHRARIEGYARRMVEQAISVLDTWQDGETRDIHQELMELTLQIACATLFGADVSADLPAVRAANLVLSHHFQSRLGSLLFLLADSVPTPGNRRYQAAVRALDGVVYRMIADHRRNGVDRGDLLSMLLAARDNEPSPGSQAWLSDAEVRDTVMTFLLAGHETTALTLAWACYLLDQNPAAAERLRAELEQELHGRSPALADLPRLPYLDAVVSETLRLYPPAYLMGRQALRDLAIGGYPIRRGSTVLISQYVVQRDPRWFDEPDSFRPERWLDGRLIHELPRFAYFPFGGGQRQCIGSTFALVEANLLLAIIAQRVRLRLVDAHPVEPQAVVTLRPRHGIRMTITPAGRAAGVPSRPGRPG
jgi:cytochrome P450